MRWEQRGETWQPEDALGQDTQHCNQVGQALCRARPRFLGPTARLQDIVACLGLALHSVSVEFLNGFCTRMHRQVPDELPIDQLAPNWWIDLCRWKDRQRQWRIAALLGLRGRHSPLAVFQRIARAARTTRLTGAQLSSQYMGFRPLIVARVGLIDRFGALVPLNFARFQNLMACQPRGSSSAVSTRDAADGVCALRHLGLHISDGT
jgi:hypothetical protein